MFIKCRKWYDENSKWWLIYSRQVKLGGVVEHICHWLTRKSLLLNLRNSYEKAPYSYMYVCSVLEIDRTMNFSQETCTHIHTMYVFARVVCVGTLFFFPALYLYCVLAIAPFVPRYHSSINVAIDEPHTHGHNNTMINNSAVAMVFLIGGNFR